MESFYACTAQSTGVAAAETASIKSVLKVWPFALWFYLGLEELPLSMEITINPRRNMSRGIICSFSTLALLAFLTIFISSSIPPGPESMSKTNYPLLIGYQFIFGSSEVVRWSCLFLTVGLIASLHSFIFATGQLIGQMASAAYFPSILSPKNGLPVAALVTGSVGAFALNTVLYVAMGGKSSNLGSVAISACLFCTLLSYTVQLSCFLHLRFYAPRLERAFRSPFGVAGAALGLLLCCISVIAILYLSATEVNYMCGIALAAGLLLIGTIMREASWIWWRREVCEIKRRCSSRRIFIDSSESMSTSDVRGVAM